MKKTVRIAFYKAQWGKLFDMAISGWTWIFNPFTPPYSHVEIGFDYGEEGWCYFSSSSRPIFIGTMSIKSGTRWVKEKDLFKHPERWAVYELEVDYMPPMVDRASKLIGKKYDWWGVFSFITITGQVFNSKDRWYCSEICQYVLTGEWVKRISPRRFYSTLKKKLKKVRTIYLPLK